MGKLDLCLYLVNKGKRFHASILKPKQHILCNVSRMFCQMSSVDLDLSGKSCCKNLVSSCTYNIMQANAELSICVVCWLLYGLVE